VTNRIDLDSNSKNVIFNNFKQFQKKTPHGKRGFDAMKIPKRPNKPGFGGILF